MRFPLLLLALCAGSAVMCHSQEISPVQNAPAKSWKWFKQSASDKSKLGHDWHLDFSQPLKMSQLLPPKAASRYQDPAIDSQCIHHPPRISSGALSSATPIMQNRYPGLTFLPVDTSREQLEANIETIPVQWPSLKLDSIPSDWPKLNLNPTAADQDSSLAPRGRN